MTVIESTTRTRHPGDRAELRVHADASWLASIRLLAGDLATRADLDLDAATDLTLAVDEACAELIGSALPGSVLTCVFGLRHDRFTVTVEVPAFPSAQIDRDGFGWRVLTTLTDDVEVLRSEPGTPWPTLGLRLQTWRPIEG